MNIKIVNLVIFLVYFVFNNLCNALENKILFKINNEIISTIDLYNETKYLSLLNENLANLKKEKIYDISKNSLIREKIKEIELLKNYKNLNIDEKYFNNLMNDYSKRMGFNNVKEFEENIEINGLDLEAIKKKIKIEVYWNQLIVKKFLRDVKIDKEKIKTGINIVDLVVSSNLLKSKSEVRRAINNRGIKVNNETIENDKENISIKNFNNENYLKLSHGKKNHIIIKII